MPHMDAVHQLGTERADVGPVRRDLVAGAQQASRSALSGLSQTTPAGRTAQQAASSGLPSSVL